MCRWRNHYPEARYHPSPLLFPRRRNPRHQGHVDEEEEEIWDWQPNWDNKEKYREQYEHPIWKDYLANGIKGGHGGMDGLVYGAFYDCVMNGYDMPINVYDAAAWMAVTNLSEQSIALGGAPMVFPDFTRGAWKEKNEDANPGPFHLD